MKKWVINNYKYDSKNNLIHIQSINPQTKKVNFNYYCYYNKNNDLQKTIENSSTGKEIRTFKYVYDNMNNWVLRETFKGDKLIFVDTRKIIYSNQ